MAKFTKKPVTLEAVQFTGTLNGEGGETYPAFGEAHPEWLDEALAKPENEPGAVGLSGFEDPPFLFVETLEGVHRASVGDWIIRGIKGELYPCKPDIFAALYDAA